MDVPGGGGERSGKTHYFQCLSRGNHLERELLRDQPTFLLRLEDKTQGVRQSRYLFTGKAQSEETSDDPVPPPFPGKSPLSLRADPGVEAALGVGVAAPNLTGKK